jgi:large subunit ribosomal protein L25
MTELILDLKEREEFGKNVNRRLRAKGMIPGVVYGRGIDNWNVAVNPKDILKIFESDSGRNTIFEIKVGSEIRDVVIKDYQLDPVKGELVHIDFQNIEMDQKMTFQIPIETVGISPGVKNSGGILDIVLREIEVECLPNNVPDQIKIDVSELDIGDAIRVSAINVDSEKITVLSEPDSVILTIAAPTAEEVEEVELEAELEAEVEEPSEPSESAEEAE